MFYSYTYFCSKVNKNNMNTPISKGTKKKTREAIMLWYGNLYYNAPKTYAKNLIRDCLRGYSDD